MAESPKNVIYTVKKMGRKLSEDEIEYLEQRFPFIQCEFDKDELVKSFNREIKWKNIQKKTLELHYVQWNKQNRMMHFYINEKFDN